MESNRRKIKGIYGSERLERLEPVLLTLKSFFKESIYSIKSRSYGSFRSISSEKQFPIRKPFFAFQMEKAVLCVHNPLVFALSGGLIGEVFTSSPYNHSLKGNIKIVGLVGQGGWIYFVETEETPNKPPL